MIRVLLVLPLLLVILLFVILTPKSGYGKCM